MNYVSESSYFPSASTLLLLFVASLFGLRCSMKAFFLVYNYLYCKIPVHMLIVE